MTTRVSRSLLILALFFSLIGLANAQFSPDELAKLSDANFVQQAKPAWRANKKAPRLTRRQVTQESLRRLCDTDAPKSANLQVIDHLSAWSVSKLSEVQKVDILQKLKARESEAFQSNLDDAVAYVDASSRLGIEDAQSDTFLIAWLGKNDAAALSTRQLEELCARLMHIAVHGNRLRVEWKGILKPPKEDRYVFFLARNDTDLEYRTGSVRSEMRVWIDGWKSIDTTHSGWHASTGEIELGPEHPKSIRVEYILDRTEGFFAPGFPGIAMLHWTTKTTERDLVPAEAFFRPDGKSPGLDAIYECFQRDAAQDKQALTAKATTVDSQIDHAWWAMTHHGFRPNRQHVAPLVVELLKRYITPESLAARLDANARNVDRNLNWWRQTGELMSSAQRKRFVKGLHQDPNFVPNLAYHDLHRIYETFYPGAEFEILDLCHRWFFLHKDVPAVFGQQMYYAKSELGLFGEMIARQAGGLEYCRDHGVTTEDGGCCMMGAYPVTWAYAKRGDLPSWTAWLDNRLSDTSLTGDRRVNWLIIRAHADLVRPTPPGYRTTFDQAPMEGWAFLDEALLHAQSDSAKLRVIREQAVRLYAVRQYDRARELLAGAARQLADEKSQNDLTKLNNEFNGLIAKLATPKAPVQNDDAEYLMIVRDRANVARERGDDVALKRYEKLIHELSGEAAAE